MTITIAPLSDAAPEAVEALLDEAFGRDRHARTAYRIRAGMTVIPDLSFAALDGSRLVGSLQCWPIALDAVPLVLVGPVAVLPDHHGEGLGRSLMAALLARAPDVPMAMIGDPDYYGRFFGFTAAHTLGWDVPGPVDQRRLLARNVDGLPKSGLLGPRSFALAGANA